MGYESIVDDAIKQLKENELNFLELVGRAVEGQAALLAPVGILYGGNLRQDISHKIITNIATQKDEKGVAIGNNIEYAIYVNKGTGIHAEDGNGRETPWTYYDPKSQKYYTTEGQKPQPYLKQAIEKQRGTIVKLAEALGVDL